MPLLMNDFVQQELNKLILDFLQLYVGVIQHNMKVFVQTLTFDVSSDYHGGLMRVLFIIS